MRWFKLFTALVVSGCAASIDDDKLDLKDPVSHTADDFHLETNSVKRQGLQIEAWECQRSDKKASGWVVVVNPDQKAFDHSACTDGVILEFGERKLNVLAINRPGFGHSMPKTQDAGGPATINAIVAAAQQWSAIGIWAQGLGAGAAAFAAKKVKSVEWLVLANGIYDMEVFLASNQDPKYAAWLKEARHHDDDSMFTEYRSIAWDASGLPKRIYLYTSAANTTLPKLQSESFRDTLKASGKHDVKYEAIDGVGLEIDGMKERLIIDRLFR